MTFLFEIFIILQTRVRDIYMQNTLDQTRIFGTDKYFCKNTQFQLLPRLFLQLHKTGLQKCGYLICSKATKEQFV